MKTILFASGVEESIAKAGDWYEERKAGLGARFIDDVDATLERLSLQPSLFQVVARRRGIELRRINVPRFSYCFLFYEDVEFVHVWDFLHQNMHAADSSALLRKV